MRFVLEVAMQHLVTNWLPRTEETDMSSTETMSPHPVLLSTQELAQQNRVFRGTGGVSEGNAETGFRPAFFDQSTKTPYLSRFADGRVAPLHVLDGLPDELILARDLNGRVDTVRNSVVAGFLRGGVFYTREQAARAVTY